MNKYIKISLLVSMTAAVAVPFTQAATVEVKWDDPSTYRDIRSTTTTQKKFEAQVVKELEAVFVKGGESLPENQTLKVQVNDVDLAGYINYFYRFNFDGVREVRNIDAPRITLSYELVDDNGLLIKSGEEKLRDKRFNVSFYGNKYRGRNTAFPYETKMIEDWYRKSF